MHNKQKPQSLNKKTPISMPKQRSTSNETQIACTTNLFLAQQVIVNLRAIFNKNNNFENNNNPPPQWFDAITELNNSPKLPMGGPFVAYLLINAPSIDENDIAFLNRLLKSGASIEPLRFCQPQLIDRSCEYKNLTLLKWLLERCELNITEHINNPQRQHSLDHIRKYPDSEFSRYFLQSLPLHSEQGETALILAVRYNYMDLFKALINTLDHDINAYDKRGLTPLMVAIEYHRFAMIDMILGKEVNLMHRSESEHTAVHYAIVHENTTLVSRLIVLLEERGHSIEELKPAIRYNLIHTAIAAKVPPSNKMKWLNTGLNDKTTEGDTPLIFACRRQNWLFAAFLANNRAVDTFAANCNQRHAGHYLSAYNQYDIIEQLLTKDQLDLTSCDMHGQNMFDVALIHGKSHEKTIKTCIKHHQKIVKKTNTSLFVFKESDHLLSILNIFCLDALDELGPWVEDGQPPLHMACVYTNNDSVAMLIKNHKLDVNQLNACYETALCFMMKQQKFAEALWFCEQFKPKLTQLDQLDSSLLQLACEQQQLAIVEWCMKPPPQNRLSTLKKRKDNCNALDIALIKQDLTIVTCLWTHLTAADQKKYIKLLRDAGENELLSFLTKHQLYVPPQPLPLSAMLTRPSSPPALPLETTHPCLIVEKEEKTIECDRSIFFDAIEHRRINWLKTLKSHRQFDELLSACAVEALRMAIEKNDYLLIYHLLRIPVIRNHAHLNQNAALLLACTLGHFDVVECLLRIEAVQQAIGINGHAIFRAAARHSNRAIHDLLLTYPEVQDYLQNTCITKESSSQRLNAQALEWVVYPRSYTDNPRLRSLLDEISDIFKSQTCDGYLYGSANYNDTPNDFDILLTNIKSEQDYLNVQALLAKFITDDGKTHFPLGRHGYKRPNRHVIPMEWKDFKVEFIVSEKDYLSHAHIVDFTIGAQYFNLKQKQFNRIPGINGAADAQTKVIKTIIDPNESFQNDLSRVFRAVRLMATKDFHLSATCDAAIKDIFSAADNPFLYKMNPDKVDQQLALLFKTNPEQNIEILHQLGILNHLFNYLVTRHDAQGQYYREKIRPFFVKYRDLDKTHTSSLQTTCVVIDNIEDIELNQITTPHRR